LNGTNYDCTRLHQYEREHPPICMDAIHYRFGVALRLPTSNHCGEDAPNAGVGELSWCGFGRGRRAKPPHLSLTKKSKRNGYALPNVSFKSYGRLGTLANWSMTAPRGD
jgi:ribosomal protein L37E